MIRIPSLKLSFSISLSITIIFHLVILFFVKKSSLKTNFLSQDKFKHSINHLKFDHIELIKPEEVEKLRRVGIKNGEKNIYFHPDMLKQIIPPSPSTKGSSPSVQAPLSLGNLAPEFPGASKDKPDISKALNSNLGLKSDNVPEESKSHFYFNPKKEKKIPHDRDQNNLKQEAFKNILVPTSNPLAQKLSNFEIRYERPEGVSEDELNSDEKAYYSFFKRSYTSYLSKLYATYDKISIERPGLEKAFGDKHLLIGKIDYDDKGNIVTVKILKSSENDDIHYFFEETLKLLNLPNPPKSFIKNKKQFTTYYQIQIN